MSLFCCLKFRILDQKTAFFAKTFPFYCPILYDILIFFFQYILLTIYDSNLCIYICAGGRELQGLEVAEKVGNFAPCIQLFII